MLLRKWNYKKRQYEPYEVPDSWNVKTYSSDMDEIVNCPHCGKELKFGDCYTSHEIHTEFGMGYGVCEDCYFNDENKRYYADKKLELEKANKRLKAEHREECKLTSANFEYIQGEGDD